MKRLVSILGAALLLAALPASASPGCAWVAWTFRSWVSVRGTGWDSGWVTEAALPTFEQCRAFVELRAEQAANAWRRGGLAKEAKAIPGWPAESTVLILYSRPTAEGLLSETFLYRCFPDTVRPEGRP